MRALGSLCAILLLCGCAAQNIKPAAKETSNQAASLGRDLSQFAEDMSKWSAMHRARIGALSQVTAIKAADAERYRAILRIVNANNEVEIERALGEFGAYVDKATITTVAAPTQAVMPPLPVESLAAIAKALADLENAGERNDILLLLVQYAKQISPLLAAAEKKEEQ